MLIWLKRMRFQTSFLLLLFILASTRPALAVPQHAVDPQVFHQTLVEAQERRERQLHQVEKVLSMPAAQMALASVGLQQERVIRAVGALSDSELSRLSAQAELLERDVAAGALTNQELTYIIIALATAVIILVIVAA